MQSPSSAVDGGDKLQTLPAGPAITKTYGKPKSLVAPTLQADESFTSDLTSLSQLSQAPSSSAPKKHRRPRRSQSDDDLEHEFSALGGAGDHYSEIYCRPSLKAMLMGIDDDFDMMSDEDEPPRMSCSFRSKEPAQTHKQEVRKKSEHKRERVVSGASSSSANDSTRINNQALASTSSPRPIDAQHSSPPTSPRSPPLKAASGVSDYRPGLSHENQKVGAAREGGQNISDSEDEEANLLREPKRPSVSRQKPSQPSKPYRRRQVIEDDEEEDEKQGSESEAEDLPSLRDAGKSRHDQIHMQSDDDGDPETQKTDAIEQYEDSQVYQSNRLSESPDSKKKSRKPRVCCNVRYKLLHRRTSADTSLVATQQEG